VCVDCPFERSGFEFKRVKCRILSKSRVSIISHASRWHVHLISNLHTVCSSFCVSSLAEKVVAAEARTEEERALRERYV
jgi:hypothetical protein